MKKKILIIGLTERMGGVETFIYNTTKFSNSDEYEYEYLIHGAEHCVFENEISDFYNEPGHFHFIRKYKEAPFGCIKDLITFYRKNGSKYSIIHFQSGATSEILYVFPYCLFFKFKIISHSHNGNGYSPIINRVFRPIVNFVTTKRLTCSNTATDWLFGKSYRKDAIIVNNGIDTERFSYSEEKRYLIRNKYKLNNELIIGHVGRFSKQKNHEMIIDIFIEIKKMNPCAKLMLIGEGEKKEKIQMYCVQKNVNNSVIFIGNKNNTEDYYSAFDVFLMPSLYEGLPIVGIEAQCSGLRCFFSDTIDEKILITKEAEMMSLNMPISEWASKIVNSKQNNNRLEAATIIEETGYGIKGTVNLLNEIYKSL